MPRFLFMRALSTAASLNFALALAGGPLAAHTTLEAESATLNGVTSVAHAGASGGYRVSQFDAVGDFISYDSAPTGSYLYLTYSLGLTTPKQCSVYIGGVDAATAVFYPTGGWSVYKPLLIEIAATGAVRLQLDADDQTFNAGESCASQDKIEIMDELTADLAGLATIGQRYRTELLSPSFSAAAGYMTSIQPDGSWSDIDYDIGEVVYTHITRCWTMFAAYHKTGHAYKDSPAMLEAAQRGFHYWMQEDWQDWNWYDNEIGATRAAAEIMLVARGDIPPADWTQGLQIVHRAWPPPDSSTGRGQNLIYRVNQTILRGVFEDDPAVTRDAMQRTADEIYAPATEGIQVDWAFQQHGPQLYWGGYGYGFAADISAISLKVAATPYALASNKLDMITSLVLDGMQWAIRGKALDPGVAGRSVSRPGHSTAGNGFAAICDRLVQSDDPRKTELENMARNIRSQAGAVPLSGNRHFFTSDFMAHHRLGFYTSFKMASNRVYGTESGNDEGLKDYHLPDGATWLYRRGDEYTNIYPVLEWRRIPGITCEQYTTAIPLCNWGANSWSDTTWAGGASDGEYGAATFHLKRLNVQARKAAFYFDDAFVLLGAGVAGTGTQSVYTSVNQCVLKGDVTVHNGTAPVVVALPAQTTYTNPKWIHHDGVGYVPLGAGSMTVKLAQQSGSYYDINHSYSTDIANVNVFSAWIDHGIKPTAGSYAYAVLPGIDTAALEAWAAAPPVTVLSNTATLQAVRHNTTGVVGAAFIQAGTIQIAPDLAATVNQPCVVVIRYSNDDFRAAVANPNAQAMTVLMTVTRNLTGPNAVWNESAGTTQLTYTLPGGDYAGKSVVQSYTTTPEPTKSSRAWVIYGSEL